VVTFCFTTYTQARANSQLCWDVYADRRGMMRLLTSFPCLRMVLHNVLQYQFPRSCTLVNGVTCCNTGVGSQDLLIICRWSSCLGLLHCIVPLATVCQKQKLRTTILGNGYWEMQWTKKALGGLDWNGPWGKTVKQRSSWPWGTGSDEDLHVKVPKFCFGWIPHIRTSFFPILSR